MKIAVTKKLINSYAPVVNGVLTSLFIFIYRRLNGAKEFEYAIPLICGALSTIISMVVIEREKKKKEKRKNDEAEIQADEIKQKHLFYSEQIKLHEKGSILFAAYESKILTIIELEGKSIQERQRVIDSLDKEISEADSFIEESAYKIDDMANKKRAS